MFGHKKHNQPPPPPAGAGYPTASPPMMPQHEPTFKIFCRADEAYCLTIRHDAVVLAPTNPRDEHQARIYTLTFSPERTYVRTISHCVCMHVCGCSTGTRT